jgi:hypothetical protein
MPSNCHRWLPYSVDEAPKGSWFHRLFNTRSPRQHARERERQLNASLPAMCARECYPSPDPEPALAPPYRVPSPAELASLPAPFIVSSRKQQATMHGVYAGGGNVYDGAMALSSRPPGSRCNDTPSTLVAGKPWLDFDTCAAEGETRENLLSTFGPCAREPWMRVNCRRTCGLCGFGLREIVHMKPWQALMAARRAARARKSAALLKLDEQGEGDRSRRHAKRRGP